MMQGPTPDPRLFHSSPWRIGAWLLCLSVVLTPWPGEAASPEIHIPTVDVAPDIDGDPGDEVWRQAPALGDFTVFEPRPGLSPAFGVTARAVRDQEALYLLIEVALGHAHLKESVGARDDYPRGGDRIEVVLDPTGTGRRGYLFLVGSGGQLYDAVVDSESERDPTWNANFDSRVQITATHWRTEIQIPFHTLRFNPLDSTWRMHLFVSSWFHQQGLSWAPIDLNVANRLPQMGTVSGMEGAQPGRAVELLPSLTAAWSQSPDDIPAPCLFGADVGEFTICDARLQYGLSVKWAITPSLSLDAAFNPDFSQVEADPNELTLNNRFALELDERRPFFMEGQDIWDSPHRVLYTRSINRPQGALKLTGSVGAVRTALLFAYDRDPPDTVSDDEGFSVSSGRPGTHAITSAARVQVDQPGLTVGAIAVDREYLHDGAHVGTNQVLGADATAHISDRLRAEAGVYVSHARPPAQDDHRVLVGHAAHGRLVWQQEAFRVQSAYRRVSEGFRSEAGYIPRRAFHDLMVKVDYYHRSEDPGLRHISPGVWGRVWLDEDLRPEDWWFGVNNWWDFGERIALFVLYNHIGERVEGRWLETNEFFGMLKIGTLEWLTLRLASVAGQTVIRDEEILDGASPYVGFVASPEVKLTLRPLASLTWEVGYQHRQIYDAPGGTLLAEQPLVRQNLSWFITRAWSIRFTTDWDGEAGLLANDLLVGWEPSPGTVFYLGYREHTQLEPTLALAERGVFLKFSMLFNL